MSTRFAVGTAFPPVTVPRIGGGELAPAQEAGWRLVLVYRHRDCPFCMKQLRQLEELQGGFAALGVSVMAMSADPRHFAEESVAKQGWTFPVGYGLDRAGMEALGLYITHRVDDAGERVFAEPGLFLINPDGKVQVADFSNAPFVRPDLSVLLTGVKVMQERNLPVLGTA